MAKLSRRIGGPTSHSVQRPLNSNSANAVPVVQNDVVPTDEQVGFDVTDEQADLGVTDEQTGLDVADEHTGLGVTDGWGNQTLSDQDMHDLFMLSPETQRLINQTCTNLWNEEMNKIRQEEQRQSNSKSQLEERIRVLQQNHKESLKKIRITEKERDKMIDLHKHVVELYEKQALELVSVTEKMERANQCRDDMAKKNEQLARELMLVKFAVHRIGEQEENV